MGSATLVNKFHRTNQYINHLRTSSGVSGHLAMKRVKVGEVGEWMSPTNMPHEAYLGLDRLKLTGDFSRLLCIVIFAVNARRLLA